MTKNILISGAIFLSIICSCCNAYFKPPDISFLRILENKEGRYREKLRFDGMYDLPAEKLKKPFVLNAGNNFSDTDSLYAYSYQPLIFFENGYVAWNTYMASFDSLTFNMNMRKRGIIKKGGFNNWGVYEVKNDTVNAMIYIEYGGHYFHPTLVLVTHFQGLIVDRDSILNWHMVPPYPKEINKYGNESFLTHYSRPLNFYFKPAPISSLINPNKAWISEYKKK
jgi:hypothetical protein